MVLFVEGSHILSEYVVVQKNGGCAVKAGQSWFCEIDGTAVAKERRNKQKE